MLRYNKSVNLIYLMVDIKHINMNYLKIKNTKLF